MNRKLTAAALFVSAVALIGGYSGTPTGDIPVTSVSTSTTTVINNANTTAASLGANDANSQVSGAYYRVYDLDESATALYSSASSGTNNSTAQGLAGPRSDETNTVNQFSTDSASHPGLIGVFTVAAGYATTSRASPFVFAANQNVVTTVRILFRTPAAASDATNDYTLYVGPVFFASGTPNFGWYIKYRHSTNSGNWQVASINSGQSAEVIGANSSVAMTPNTWQTLVVTFPASGTAVSMALTVNGTTSNLGSVTNADTAVPFGSAHIAGAAIVRNATNGSTYRAAYVDRASIYRTGMTGLGS